MDSRLVPLFFGFINGYKLSLIALVPDPGTKANENMFSNRTLFFQKQQVHLKWLHYGYRVVRRNKEVDYSAATYRDNQSSQYMEGTGTLVVNNFAKLSKMK